MNTFLNAMTYPRIKPWFTGGKNCNDQDLEPDGCVHMDAVFHPNIYKDPEIFMQEGWHYELETR